MGDHKISEAAKPKDSVMVADDVGKPLVLAMLHLAVGWSLGVEQIVGGDLVIEGTSLI